MTHITEKLFRRRGPRSLAAMIFAGALTLSACTPGGSPQDPEGTGPETPPPETTSAQTTSAQTTPVSSDPEGTAPDGGTTPLGEPDTSAKQQHASGDARLALSDMRVGRHETFDRVVLDLEGEGTPGWWTTYTDTPRAPGSGHPIDYNGNTALNVEIEGIHVYESDLGHPHLDTVPGAGGVVSEVVHAGVWFEGRGNVVIGVDGILPYSVQVMEEPKRLVIDILHEGGGEGAPVAPLGEPNLDPKFRESEPPHQHTVADVRLATHETFDRVVFDIHGEGTAGWSTLYTPNPIQLGSGDPVEYRGSMALEILIEGVAGATALGVTPGSGGVVTEVIESAAYHGQSQFIIGLNHTLPYSVQLLEDPQRVVVDIPHEGIGQPVTPLGHPDTEPKSRDSGEPHARVISGVRVATHEGFDRVVFDTVHEGSVGWFTGYVPEPVQAASGLPVEYQGSMALEVNLTGVVHHSGEGHEQPNLGTIPGAGGAVNEVISVVTHHGQSQFVIGLDGTLPHSIQTLDEPHRVVVDILHG